MREFLVHVRERIAEYGGRRQADLQAQDPLPEHVVSRSKYKDRNAARPDQPVPTERSNSGEQRPERCPGSGTANNREPEADAGKRAGIDKPGQYEKRQRQWG